MSVRHIIYADRTIFNRKFDAKNPENISVVTKI